jgi:aminoglycoside 6'-N-acetyltransferase
MSPVDTPTLQGERVRLRGLADADAERVAEINALPDVARWWRPESADEIRAKIALDDLATWAVELEGELIGYVEAYEEAEPDFRHAGLDLFLLPAVHGRGLGRDVVRTVVRHLIEDRRHHRVVIDPAVANETAIRSYEAVGFRRVGLMRRYWFDHVDERWTDGLLLDLLAGELR